MKVDQSVSFRGVALTIIGVGIVLVGLGLASWVVNMITHNVLITFPSFKVIGGFIIIALGYIHLELELLRKQ